MGIPGLRGLVPRFKSIKIEYFDRKGKKVKGAFADFVARIFQHELDHLDGIMFMDRMETTKDLISDKEYQKLMTKKQ